MQSNTFVLETGFTKEITIEGLENIACLRKLKLEYLIKEIKRDTIKHYKVLCSSNNNKRTRLHNKYFRKIFFLKAISFRSCR